MLHSPQGGYARSVGPFSAATAGNDPSVKEGGGIGVEPAASRSVRRSRPPTAGGYRRLRLQALGEVQLGELLCLIGVVEKQQIDRYVAAIEVRMG